MRKSFIAKVIADYRVTIPKDQRKKQGTRIRIGDYVEIQLIRKVNKEA